MSSKTDVCCRRAGSVSAVENKLSVVYTVHMAERKNNKKNTKGTGLALALWVLAALVLLIFFLVNQGRIFSNLKATDFFSQVFGKTPAFVEKANVEDKHTEKNDVIPLPESSDVEISLVPEDVSNREEEVSAVEPEEYIAEKNTKADAPSNTQAPAKTEVKTDVKTEDKKSSETAPAPAPVVRTMNIRLCFMTINSDGSVSRKEVTRVMKKSDSPLVDAVNALISGPTVEEEGQGCRTLVSSGTRLIGASVKNGIATLNFSQEFEFNQLGIEGLRGQLQQIVYTATAFPTVESVQFLVDGEKKEYLGSEGVWIGTPLTRKSF